MNAKFLVLAAAISLAPTASYAHTWFMENAATASCDLLPANGVSSPSDAEDQLRSENIIPTISEDNNPDGSISVVTISYTQNGGDTIEMQFFTSIYRCQDQVSDDLKAGIITDPNSLK